MSGAQIHPSRTRFLMESFFASAVIVLLIGFAVTACAAGGYNNLTRLDVLRIEAGDLQVLKEAIKRDRRVLKTQDRVMLRTPLHAAARCGDMSLACEALSAGAKVDVQDRDGVTPLHLAARHGQLNIAKLLLEHGASSKIKDNFGYTPLHAAAFCRSSPSMELLLDYGAEINARDSAGDTALELVVSAWQQDARVQALPAVQLLLSRGADARVTNSWGQTALHTAAMNGYSDVGEMLLKHGADVNARSNYNTPISLAARSLHPDVIKLLIANGADVNAVDYTGRPVLLEAIDGPNKGDRRVWDKELAAVELLLSAGADPW